ncbi:tetratricopeptide repeat protein [Streptomyces sp. NPDC007070]|uniref:tetratricopeptide repeat protein n=1 Tax=Streptomyces sp. NPDC007070 TaxID=3154312 RepID=UPI0033F88E05
MALNLAAPATGAQGRHAEALATYDEALPVFGKIFGADHFLTLKLRSDRAQQMISLGQYTECEAECTAVIEAACRGTRPEMSFLAAAARNGLVFALNALGRHQEAKALAREALASHPARDRASLVLRLGLARSLNGQARHEDALTEAQGAKKLYRALPEYQRHPDTGAVELAFASAQFGVRRVAEARRQAAAAHDACLASFLRTTAAPSKPGRWWSRSMALDRKRSAPHGRVAGAPGPLVQLSQHAGPKRAARTALFAVSDQLGVAWCVAQPAAVKAVMTTVATPVPPTR